MQSVVEGVVLSSAGAAAGLVLARAAIATLARLEPAGVPQLDSVRVDVPVIVFSVGIAAMAALGTSLLPAIQSSNVVDALKSGALGASAGARRRRLRHVLCIAELAVSLVLLVGASLLGRSLVRLMYSDLGVETDHVVTASMNLAFGVRPADSHVLSRMNDVVGRVGALPGVHAVGVGTGLPPNVSRLMLTLRRTGDVVDYRAAGIAATPGYFQALGMRLVTGRLFTADDDLNHPPVMIMSVDSARRFFGDGDPIGQTMGLPVSRNGFNQHENMTLVGIVANVKFSGLEAEPDDAVYRPFAQQI